MKTRAGAGCGSAAGHKPEHTLDVVQCIFCDLLYGIKDDYQYLPHRGVSTRICLNAFKAALRAPPHTFYMPRYQAAMPRSCIAMDDQPSRRVAFYRFK
jgi:hypothetical protein